MLELRNIVKIYQGGTVNETCLFNEFNLTIPDQQFVCVVGSNGSGKTSLLNIICGSIPIDEGCIMCQYQRYFDISMGTGTLVLAVASVIVGSQLMRGLRFLGATTAVVLGSILYKGCVALALSMGLSPFDLKLVTAALLLVIIIAGGQNRKKVKHRA